MDITNIRRMAKELNLHNIYKAPLSLFESDLPNVEFLELILKTELAERKAKNLYKARKASRLPKTTALTKLESVTEWQLNELKKLYWIDDAKKLFIVGNCGSGKTELATTIGNCCLDSGYKVYYLKADELITILNNKEANPKAKKTYEYIKSCDLLIIDEFMYIVPTPEELTLLYRALTFLSEAQSIIFITNRELSDWTKTTEDKHLMQTLLSSITANSQILKL